MMLDDIIALAGDLVVERKRLTESLRRLEGVLLKNQTVDTADVHSELDHLARALDRIGALTKTLVHHVNSDRLVSAEVFVNSIQSKILELSRRHDRPLSVDVKGHDTKIERDTLERFRPVLFEMLEPFIEYCLENPKERLLRKKKPKSIVQVEVKAVDQGTRLTILCDGNGILPPMAAEHGLKLAQAGVRASFEGKPGQWAAWVFYLPTSVGSVRCLPIQVGKRTIYVPSFVVLSVTARSSSEFQGKVWTLTDSLDRQIIDPTRISESVKNFVNIGSGIDVRTYAVDAVGEQDEVIIKPLHQMFSAKGRFLGVVVVEKNDTELCLVINPGYLVYGDQALVRADIGEVPHAI